VVWRSFGLIRVKALVCRETGKFPCAKINWAFIKR
jgi:hypothetical protein